ncbi:hypothetical protein JL100_022660 [Skermanella mucosa]|uniref:hypothetical protein n=1 Tax=Skermanella mucosa TaxID=1789672 RepID=UPI00192B2923|nr:hypothetical protein [Skermanella mucosa]UEM19858.1 hypothetical protein JL100_022660 [Skermanella mucosa]
MQEHHDTKEGHDEKPHDEGQAGRLISIDSLKRLYLAERSRRSNVQSLLSVPVSIISFSIFGFVSFAQYLDVSRWREPVTMAMIVLCLASLTSMFAAMARLVKLDRRLVLDDFDRIEAVREAKSEIDYFHRAYNEALASNVDAERDRNRAFSLLILALVLFLVAVFLMPVHLIGTGVNGR